MLVYHKNILRHIAVIPLGGKNITKDISSLNNDDMETAEKMKIKYGCAYTEVQDRDKTLEYSIDVDHKVSSVKFQQVVEARMQEIIENVWAQVPPEYQDKLNGGIVLTGGGANLRNIETAFRKRTKIEKVTTALFIRDTVNSNGKGNTVPHDGTMNTLLGLMMKGDINCDGGDLDLQQNIFNKDAEPTTLKPGADAGAGDVPMTVQTGTGRVPTPNDKMIQEKQNDKKEWEKAVQDNTIEAYERYKATYPGGEYVAQANEKIEEMKRKESFGSRWGIFKRKIKDFITEAEDE